MSGVSHNTVTGIGTIGVPVTDQDRALTFYAETA